MSEVFSSPCVPIPDSDFDILSEIIGVLPPVSSGHQQMSMQQPPEQPLFDNPHHFDEIDYPTPSTVVKQEQQTGFLSTWDQDQLSGLSLGQGQDQMLDIDRCSPEEQKRFASHLTKVELQCHIKLKMMKEGKEFSSEAEDQTTQRDYPISEETRELQKIRRQKNREAAKKCRQKKRATERDQEQRLREKEKEIQELRLQIQQYQGVFYDHLQVFPNMPTFLAYLKQNRQLLHSPTLKPMLQKYVQTFGGRMAIGPAASATSQTVPSNVGVPQGLAGFPVEQ